MQPETPLETADLAWAFGSLCGLLRQPFDARLFLQQFPPPASVASLHHAAASLGLRLTPRRSVPGFDGPQIAFQRSGNQANLAIVLGVDESSVLIAQRDEPARQVPHAEYASRFEGALFGVSKPEQRPGAEAEALGRTFGLAWFVPELLRHRSIWRDVLVASLAMQLIALATPLCTQVVIDKVIAHQAHSTLVAMVSALAVFLVFTAALGYARQYLLLHTGNRIDSVLGMRVFEHLMRLPPRYFEHRPTGTLVARLQGVETVREFLTGAGASLAIDLPFVIVFVAIMYWYSATLTGIALVAILILAVLSVAVTPVLRRRINAQFLAGARNQAFVTEYVSAMETVKALQLEPQLGARYGANLADYLRASFSARHLANTYSVLASALEQTLTITILAAGAWLVMAGQGFTIGMLVAFQMFASRLAQPVLRMAAMWHEFQQAAIAMQRLGDVMDAPPESALARASTVREDGPARIDIEAVSFAYAPDQKPVLDNFSLRLEPGACVALTGPSGSGKSTLARLLLGFYLPTKGAVRVDGRDTRGMGAAELRLHFGVVPQETRLFSGTILENVALAQPHASLAEVIEACRLAEIHAFIESLPAGYQTQIGEHGAGLSGGQKQRIAIGRALLRRPRILIFDEATASLDRDTAEALGHTVSRLRGRITMLFISHNVPESLSADSVARMERGLVVA